MRLFLFAVSSLVSYVLRIFRGFVIGLCKSFLVLLFWGVGVLRLFSNYKKWISFSDDTSAVTKATWVILHLIFKRHSRRQTMTLVWPRYLAIVRRNRRKDAVSTMSHLLWTLHRLEGDRRLPVRTHVPLSLYPEMERGLQVRIKQLFGRVDESSAMALTSLILVPGNMNLRPSPFSLSQARP